MHGAWEVLELADGSIFFNGVHGRHLHLHDPRPELRLALRGADGNRPLPEILAQARHGGEGAEQAVEALFRRLTEKGVLTGSPERRAPAWAGADVLERFHSEVEYLDAFTRGDVDGFEYLRRLRDAHVTVIGLGGAGSLCAMLLAAVGVGRLTIVEGDVVERSNLVRQIFYEERQTDRTRKVDALAERLRLFSSHTEVTDIATYVSSAEHAADLVRGTDFVLLCADAPRFLLNRWVNEACVKLSVPYLNAFAGTAGPMFVPGRSPCFTCLEESFRRELGGAHDLVVDALQARRTRQYPSYVVGPMQMATIQVNECVAHLTGAWDPATLGARLVVRGYTTTAVTVPVSPRCPACTDAGDPAETAAVAS